MPKVNIKLEQLQILLRTKVWRIVAGFKLPKELIGVAIDKISFDPKAKKINLYDHWLQKASIDTSDSIDIEKEGFAGYNIRIRTLQSLKQKDGSGKLITTKPTASVVILHLRMMEEVVAPSKPNGKHVAKPVEGLEHFIERMKTACLGKRIEDIEADEDGVTVNLEDGRVIMFDFERSSDSKPKLVISTGDDTGDDSFELT